MSEIIIVPNTESYYNQKNSCYLRIEFISPMGFRITMRNELLLSQDCDTKSGEFIGAIGRGLLQVGYSQGEEIYNIGQVAAFQDMLEASGEGLEGEAKEAWTSNDINRSVH